MQLPNKNYPPSKELKYSFKCISTIEEFDTIKDALIYYASNREEPNMIQHDIEYFKFLIKDGLLKGKPLICVLYENDSPAIISVGFVQKVEIFPSIAYLKLRLFKFKKNCYYIYQYGVLGGNNTLNYPKIFIKMLLDNLRKSEVDFASFNLLRKNTAFSSALLNISNPLIRDFTPYYEKHFILKTPESLDSFLSTKSKQSRHNLKKVIKQLEKEYEGKYQVRIFTDEKDVDQCFEDMENVSQKSYLRALNVGFKPTKNQLLKKKWLANKDYFRTYLLYLNNIPVAFIQGMIYKRHFLGENMAFDMAYEKLRLGRYLQLKLIEDIANSKCADFIDFGYGPDSYKESFSSDQYDDIRIKIYLPKLSNLFFKITFTIFSYLNKWTRNLLIKTKLYDRTRKSVRSVIAKKTEIKVKR